MNKTRITTVFLVALLIFGSLCGIAVSADESEGVPFTADDLYQTQSPLSALPATYEATFRFPVGTSGRGGGKSRLMSHMKNGLTLHLVKKVEPRSFQIARRKQFIGDHARYARGIARHHGSVHWMCQRRINGANTLDMRALSHESAECR